MKNFIQPGMVMPFVAEAAVVSGQVVVIGNMLGVAQGNYALGEVGQANLEGVYLVPKVAGADISQGSTLVWDVSAGAFDDAAATPAVGDITGQGAFAFETPAIDATEMLVKLTGVPGVIKT